VFQVELEAVPPKRGQPLVQPRNRVGVVAGDLARPGTHFFAPLPPADIEQDNISAAGFHSGPIFSQASRSPRVIGVPGSTHSTPFNCAMSYRTARVKIPSFQFITPPLMQPASGVMLSFAGMPLYI